MDYSKMKSSIDRAILKSPLDVAAYDDKFALCRDYEGTEFRLAHKWNQALQEEIRAGLKLAVDTRDYGMAKGDRVMQAALDEIRQYKEHKIHME